MVASAGGVFKAENYFDLILHHREIHCSQFYGQVMCQRLGGCDLTYVANIFHSDFSKSTTIHSYKIQCSHLYLILSQCRTRNLNVVGI
jgi:hypothetical protein